MNADLIIPSSFGDPERDAARRFVHRHYLRTHPGLNIVIGVDTDYYTDGAPWSKGRAVANGVERSRKPIIVIADADVVVPPEAIGYSIMAVLHGAAWSMPHGEVHRLSRRGTNAVYANDEPLLGEPNMKWTERRHPGPYGGGMVVTTRAAYEVTGIDPRFIGFGGDDISFARALDTLVGPCERFDYPMTHLFHARTPRRHGNRGSEENEALAARYMIADGDPPAMREIIAEFKVVA